jgi:hypothetical protein
MEEEESIGEEESRGERGLTVLRSSPASGMKEAALDLMRMRRAREVPCPEKDDIIRLIRRDEQGQHSSDNIFLGRSILNLDSQPNSLVCGIVLFHPVLTRNQTNP